MPPKSQVGTSPVYSMEHEQQVQLLSDALLREYMHRKGFRKTLSVFDQEHPRDKDTISSRAVMADLMALSSADQQRLKGEGIETIMEMLCDLRIERRQLVESLQAQAAQPVPEVPAACLNIIAKHNQNAAAKLQRAEAKREQRMRERHNSSSFSSSTRSPIGPLVQLDKEMTIDDLLQSDSDSEHDEADRDDEKDKRATSAGEAHAEPNWLGALDGKKKVKNTTSRGPSHIDGDELEDNELEDEEREKVGDHYETAREGGMPCSSETFRNAYRMICGSRSAPPRSYLQQGIAFDDAVGFRLIQWEKGPSAAIAPIQAFVGGFYFERSFIESCEHQRHSRIRAISHILQAAQPDLSLIVLVDGLLYLRHPTHDFQKQLSTQFVHWTGFSSLKELEKRLSLLVTEHWSRPKGCGLWCFLLSLVLSRGLSALKADGCSHPLMDEGGNGTLNMLNLFLCGAAKSTTTPETYRRMHLHCGFLSGEPTQGSTSHTHEFPPLGTPLNPVLPTWVISHERHFSNLFMKKDTRKVFEQKRALGGSATVELTYWDALTDDDEVTVEVQASGAAWGGRRRNANSYVNNAILSVPPWDTAVIDWRNAVPPQ